MGYDYFDYVPHHPELTCYFGTGELSCMIAQPSSPIKAGPLVTIQSHAPTTPAIIWVERNFDSLSLPRLVIIRPTAQFDLFLPVMVK